MRISWIARLVGLLSRRRKSTAIWMRDDGVLGQFVDGRFVESPADNPACRRLATRQPNSVVITFYNPDGSPWTAEIGV